MSAIDVNTHNIDTKRYYDSTNKQIMKNVYIVCTYESDATSFKISYHLFKRKYMSAQLFA